MKELENQVAQEERQMQFFQKVLNEQRKLERTIKHHS